MELSTHAFDQMVEMLRDLFKEHDRLKEEVTTLRIALSEKSANIASQMRPQSAVQGVDQAELNHIVRNFTNGVKGSRAKVLTILSGLLTPVTPATDTAGDQRDAARYRWLLANRYSDDGFYVYTLHFQWQKRPPGGVEQFPVDKFPYLHESLDEALNDAMLRQAWGIPEGNIPPPEPCAKCGMIICKCKSHGRFA